ncbi:MAG: aminodeoxychorismate synthase component I [Solibacillus sp.]
MHFAYKTEEGDMQLRTFEQPLTVISTVKIEDVLPCLERVLAFTKDGYFAAGYVSYEASPAFDSAYAVHEKPTMPLLYFAIYESATESALQADGHFNVQVTSSDTTELAYAQAIETIKARIEDGITYQTNYTVRLYGEFDGDALAFFNELQHSQQAGYTAYLQCDDTQILSASPELFFHLKDNTLTTKPMKGTSRRGKSADEDIALAHELHESEKNRAENVMIVDLLRNDLGKIAVTDSVEVTKLFDVEHYPTVHQMTSTVQATLQPELNIIDVFKALFPCGSITGAPKISTMNVIAELEASPRDVYCGAVGFITPQQEAIFNVPIRTAVIEDNKLTYGVGGGITWDSTASGEFDEVLAKAQVLTTKQPHFELLESLLLEDGSYFLLERHVERLQKSANYFNFPFDEPAIRAQLELEAQQKSGLHKVRLVLAKTGALLVESTPIQQMNDTISVALAQTAVNSDDVFLYHKTTYRTMYTVHEIPEGCFDVLLYNERDEITEFTFGNIVYEIGGELYTPPVSSGLLAGTYRAELLATGEITERVLMRNELAHLDALYFINSVRKMKKARLSFEV